MLVLALCLPTAAFAADAQNEVKTTQDYVNDMQPGWNLGNTFDAVGEDETAWGNPRVTQEFIENLADQGFKSIRIPVTFDQRMLTEEPYTIEEDFLDRLDQVIEWSLDEGLYVMINIHHDSWIWLEKGMHNDHDASLARFKAIWTQLADRYKDMPQKLMFESINEPRFEGEDAEKQKYIDELNTAFYNIVRSSGGINDVRKIVLPTLDTGSETHKVDALYDWIKALAKPDPNIIATVHYYGFWPFSVNIAGFTTFNEETQKDIITVFDRVHDKFVKNGIPVIIGEFGLLGFDTDLNAIEQGEKLKFFEFMIHYAQEKQLTHMLWDNGQHFGRQSFEWSNQPLYEMMKASWSGRSGTADSDFIYLKQGEEIADVVKTLQLNGNTFEALELNGEELEAGADYAVEGDKLTVKASLLEELASTSGFGEKAELTVVFNQGMEWTINVIEYDTPSVFSAAGEATGFEIPALFRGDSLATMEAVYTDGGNAGPQNWTSFKEFAYTFTPNYANQTILLKENFFKEVEEGKEVQLKLHFWSGEVLEYKLIKEGTSVTGTGTTAGSASFSDLGGVAWAQDGISFLAERSIVQGVGEGMFQPEGMVTRAEFIQMLMNTLGLVDDSAVSTFSDVKEDAWYTAAVASAEKLGIVTGQGNGKFGANAEITRQDAAVMLYRAMTELGFEAADGAAAEAFADQDAISAYAVEAVAQMQQAGILQGKGGSFKPFDLASRAEAAVMIYRLFAGMNA
nr:cellulase family glycosylhydrolase [Paenibacillus soyae]